MITHDPNNQIPAWRSMAHAGATRLGHVWQTMIRPRLARVRHGGILVLALIGLLLIGLVTTLATRPAPEPVAPAVAEVPVFANPHRVAQSALAGHLAQDEVVTVVVTETPTPTDVPPGFEPDECEDNDRLTQPCALPTDVTNDDFNFVDDDLDVYSFFLKGERTYTIRATSEDGVDPAITVYLAGDTETVIAENDDAAAGTTNAIVQIETSSDAWYLVAVENRTAGDMEGRLYSIRAQSAAVMPPPDEDDDDEDEETPTPTAIGDPYENNYSVQTAARIPWAVPLDLSLTCPDVACRDGDHDFFLVDLKGNVPFTAVTYDLGPGVDTDIALYVPDPAAHDDTAFPGWRSVAANDDIAPGYTLRSQIDYTPPGNGRGLLVVAPSDREEPPVVPPTDTDPRPGRYRLITGSPDLQPVSEVLEQVDSDLPSTPTPTATQTITATTVPPGGASQPVPRATAPPPPDTPPPPPPPANNPPPPPEPTAGEARQVIEGDCATGMAVIIVDGTTLYAAVPPVAGDILETYPVGTEVELEGTCYLGWVKGTPLDAVTPGWLYGPNLRMRTGPAAAASPVTSPGPSPVTSPVVPPATQVGAAQLVPLPTLTPTPLPGASPSARTLDITVCIDRGRTCEPQPGIVVEVLLAVSNRVLATGRTNVDGAVTISFSAPSGARLALRSGAVGSDLYTVQDRDRRIRIEVPVLPIGGDDDQ